jgi:hypothetical protein
MFGKHPAFQGPAQEWRPAVDPEIPSRSCCCPARPVVKVIMPPAGSRDHPVELYLCGHHYHASTAALLVAGAHVEDLTKPAEPDLESLVQVV